MQMSFPVLRARCSSHPEPDEGSVSISVLNRHIHTLRRRIRHFEERFEEERHYKVRRENQSYWCFYSLESWLDWKLFPLEFKAKVFFPNAVRAMGGFIYRVLLIPCLTVGDDAVQALNRWWRCCLTSNTSCILQWITPSAGPRTKLLFVTQVILRQLVDKLLRHTGHWLLWQPSRPTTRD